MPDLEQTVAELVDLAAAHDAVPSFTDNAEDVVVARAFAAQPSGVWVDVGAGHPLWGSTTKRLSMAGWWGLNLEPQPDLLEALAADRPRDVNRPEACGASTGRSRFFRIVDNWGLSTTDPEVAAGHRRDGWRVEEAEVAVARLDDLWDEHLGDQPVDLLKIDAEGAEADVLAGVDLAGRRPRLLVIESTVPNRDEPCWDAWEPVVLAAGYRLCLFDGLNRFYALEGDVELAGRASVPANVFDRFAPLSWLGALRRQRRAADEAHGALADAAREALPALAAHAPQRRALEAALAAVEDA